MTDQCETCAFREGAAAFREPHNRLKGLICAYGAKVFWCHHGRDGQEYDWRKSVLGPMDLAPENRKVCGGWQRLVARLKRRGYFPNRDYVSIRRWVAEFALSSLDTYTKSNTPKQEKQSAWSKVKERTKFLFAKDIGDLEIPL